MPKLPRPFVLACILLALCLTAPVAAAAPEPGVVVTQADVEKVLGGKFKARVVEPGIVSYEEEGTGYRVVQVFLFPANGKTVSEMKQQFLQWGEPIDDVADIGDAAMYRSQSFTAVVEKADKSGEVLWLEVAAQNVDDKADAKRFAVELAKRGAARL